jgi:hypothetical protein
MSVDKPLIRECGNGHANMDCRGLSSLGNAESPSSRMLLDWIWQEGPTND